jgi:hypothetical protein
MTRTSSSSSTTTQQQQEEDEERNQNNPASTTVVNDTVGDKVGPYNDINITMTLTMMERTLLPTSTTTLQENENDIDPLWVLNIMDHDQYSLLLIYN